MTRRYDSIKDRCTSIVEDILASPDIPYEGEAQFKWRLSIEEAVGNIINYAYGGDDGWMEATICTTPDHLGIIIRFKDGGIPFNPLEEASPDFSIPITERRPGGLGIHFIKKVMDNVSYERIDGCNVLTLTRKFSQSRLSQSQLGIWYACRNLTDEKCNYQIPFLYKLPDTVDIERLKRSLDAFIKAHPYILSRIVLEDEEPMTIPGPFREVIIREVGNLDGLSFGRTADLLQDSLFRIELYRTPDGNYLFMDFHHIVFDGGSFTSLKEDIKTLYDGNDIRPESIDGAAIAEREWKIRKSDEWQKQREWYLQEFQGAQDVNSEPVHNDSGNDGEIAEQDISLPVSESTIDVLCTRFGVKKSVVFLGAWAKMLANYTAENKAAFATIHHGRNDADTRRSIDMMVRTLPVFCDMPGGNTVAEWLHSLSQQQDGARNRTAYSFSDIHQDLGLRGDIIFAYQGNLHISDSPLQIGNESIPCRDMRTPRPGTTLDAQLYRDDSGFVIRVGYNTSFYSKEMISGMVESYAAILDSMLTAERICDLMAASDSQKKWLDSQNPVHKTKTFIPVIEQFQVNAESYPDAECCVSEERRYTYREIDAISDELAFRISEAVGVRDGIPVVSFISPRNEWMVIMPLAIAKAGCTYQPLDSSYPKERLEFMVSDAHSKLVVCTPEFCGTVSIPELIVTDTSTGRHPDKPEVSPDDIFVLLYTSGTTGTPKGVCLTQNNFFSFCHSAIETVHISRNSRLASYASYGFDAYQMDLWSALTRGASLHIISEDIRYDLDAIHQYFVRENITHSVMTTQVGTQMALNYPDIPSLDTLTLGGEKMVSINPPSYRILNGYGPTENTVFITSYPVSKYENNIPIGTPTPDTHIYIVNKDGQRVPMGAAGELWSAGDQIAGGYLGLPEKTAEVFIPNPFENGPFNTIYRTGDIVRYREDGQIVFVGRKDRQVKIRGFRIELKEVESIIREYPEIDEVTVQAFDLEDGGKAIAAYIVSRHSIDTSDLGSFILKTKPPYMVPAVILQVDSIPLNVNGKVDVRKLPKPEMKSQDDGNQPAAPLNILEESLQEIITKTIGCPKSGITTPLSQQGLTSISGLKLSALLFKKYGITVTMKELTQGETLQSIENRILSGMLEGKEDIVTDTPPVNKTLTEAPLTNAQTGIYLECLKHPESTVYNIPQLISFPDGTSPERIKSALGEVIKKHPIFFSYIDDSVNPPLQRINTEAKPLISLSDTPAEELAGTFVQPFNLNRGPLYRAVVSGRHLLFDAHHLIMDGASVSIILHQLCDILDGKKIEDEGCSYFEHAVKEQSADNGEAEKFFEKCLASVEEASSFPADLHGDEMSGRQSEIILPVDHDSVAGFSKSHGITPAAVYLTAFEYLTSRYCSTRDVCICSVSSGRGDISISGTAGMFVNTIALSAHIAEGSISELIDDNAARFRETLRYENYPFAKISDRYGLNPGIVFVYQIGLIDSFRTKEGEVIMNGLELSAPKFKFCLLVEERNGKISLVGQYNNALYSEDMVSRLLDSLAHIIHTMVTSPQMPVSKLSIVSDTQRKELEWMHNGPIVPMPVRLFHKGIERWKGSHKAIIARDAELTYDEFDSLGNRIANALISKGLKKGQAVVVLLPRRSTTLGAIYGILKAGGAFIPCDPEYPAERIRLIAEDSDAQFVLTTSELAGNYPDRGVCIDDLLECMDITNPNLDINPDDTAYMIYTSGSTGRPKGVRVSHGNITACLTITEVSPYYPMISECERLCDVFTISFDAFIMEFGIAFFHGRTFVFSDEIESKDPIALAALLKRTGADCMGGTSSRWLQYLELPELTECIRQFKAVLQGGEKFSELLLAKFRELNPYMAIINGYGPTEITINCNSSDLSKATWLTVGKPAPNYTEWVLDSDLNELPVGVTGELCVGGPGVTQGYNNLPELTAQKYITYSGMRAFRTGDYARWHDDGQIEILGRTDNQVKLRGLRIELGEVESAISRVEGVRNVLVRICRIGGLDHLSAYYVADRKIDITDMKKAISTTLTAYMVPDAYLQMDAFPITPNGKVDFRHLPEPVLAQSDREYTAPVGADEIFFANTFARILGLDRVGATDSFFELGGTSLLVMKVVIMAQQRGCHITYADVFSHPTARGLAILTGLDSQKEDDPDADIRNYDYSAIDRIIKSNTLESFIGERTLRPLGSVLLTGATGFLGMHILNCLLERYPDSEIHCLLRSKRSIPPQMRLRQMMFYYFEKDISPEIGKRIFVHEGDVTAPFDPGCRIDTVINCAALVKHFAKGTEIEDVNTGGVKNCIEYCRKANARLIQISTYSVGGASVNGIPDVTAFNETMLFAGQRIANQYVHSKIMGERLILEAVVEKGLDAKIMRVGNLSARSLDGEFQINVRANSFMGRLNIYQMLGALPYSAFQSPVEFSPIDQTAEAICLLAGTTSSLTVLHPYNPHYQMLGDVLKEMDSIGKKIRLVEDSEFIQILEMAKQDESMQGKLSSMLAYESDLGKDILRVIPPENGITVQILLRLGFRWDMTSWNYVDKFLNQINGLKFFESAK